MSARELREGRIAEILGAVATQALLDRGARRVALLDDGSPEAVLAERLLVRSLGAGRVVRIATDPGLESVLQPAAPDLPRERIAEEARRLRARLTPDALPAHPASKTALLLGGELPPEPLLPLGDLYATEVAALAGGWSAPEPVRALAERAGGIERLDEALRLRIDGRDAAGLTRLPVGLAREVESALSAGRASRATIRVVPKIGSRTLGVDLFE